MNQHRSLELPPQRVALTVNDVALLDRAGAFDDYGKVELNEGDLLYVNAQYRRHMVVKSELAYRLRRAREGAGSPLFVGTEGSVALSDHDLPQPDILVTDAADGDGAVPGSSIALLIEVADTTLAFDLGRKARIYARAGVPEYWVADVNGRVIHQLWRPESEGCAERRSMAFGAPVTAITVSDLTVPTTSL